MFLGICIVVAVVVAVYFVYDWRRTSRLKRDLATGTGRAPDPSATPSPDARHGLDATTHQAKNLGNQVSGGGFI